jgi:hypothetical protein
MMLACARSYPKVGDPGVSTGMIEVKMLKSPDH